jgi:TetR/AcrR family transcriptional repressor of bet genes
VSANAIRPVARRRPAKPAAARKPVPARARREDPAIRRQDLLAVTLSCLAKFGPRGTTGREICRQAGVSHGLLRHYFVNPDNLLLETYQQLCDNFLDRFEGELSPAGTDPWVALDHFFKLLFSEEWASADVLGAWMAFWTLVRTNDDIRAVSDSFSERLRALLAIAAARLPQADRKLPLDDAVALLSAVMDGLWLDFCLSPSRTSRERAIQLTNAAARRFFAD